MMRRSGFHKGLPSPILLFALILAMIAGGGMPAAQADIRLVLIGKTANDTFYQQAFQGCEEFARQTEGLECLYDGPMDFQDPFSQVKVVERHIANGVDGILLSTTDSDMLAEGPLLQAQEQGIPVITFDSDLLPEHEALRLAYVGTNNFKFGVALGNAARQFANKTGIQTVCIQSGANTTPNLNDRIRGVRYALSDNESISRLSGNNGVREIARCPFYSSGKRNQALNQLLHVMQKDEPVVFVAVAGFAQFSEDYITRLAPYEDLITSGEKVIISADAEPGQLDALKANLSTLNIGQRPFEMGRKSAQLMYEFLSAGTRPESSVNYLGFYNCARADGGDCVQSDGN